MKLVAFRQSAAESDPLAAFGSESANGLAGPPPKPSVAPAGSRRVIWLAAAAVALAAAAVAGVVVERRWATPPALGTVTITTTPVGAEVVVGGVSRGRAPLTFTAAPGVQTIVVVNGGQRIPVDLTVGAGATVAQHVVFGAPDQALQVSVPEPRQPAPPAPARTGDAVAADGQKVAAGFVAVTSPISLRMVEGGQVIGSSDLARLMLPAGVHDVELVNEDLGFRERRRLTVASGKRTVVTVDLPRVPLNINAAPWADVTVDNQHVGDTPIGNYSVTIGPHVVTFRHPDLGERQQRIMVGLNSPARVSVDLAKKDRP